MDSRFKDRRLYVSNLSDGTTETDLRTFFSQYGPVNGVTLKTYRHTSVSTGCAYIEMENEVVAKAAIRKADNQILHARQIRVMRVRNQ